MSMQNDPSDPANTGRLAVNQVAETHYMIRPMLISRLKLQLLTDSGRQSANTTASSYLEFWQQGFGDRFFDMGTFIRLGTAVEQGLRHYHQQVTGIRTHGLIFQRLINPKELIDLFLQDCEYDLQQNSHFEQMREIMVHRHLYAHRSGIIDEQYINDLRRITGQDIRSSMTALGYPDEDVYWFEPLKRLDPSEIDAGLIDAARGFFKEMKPPTT